jgi:hypothetical protein
MEARDVAEARFGRDVDDAEVCAGRVAERAERESQA